MDINGFKLYLIRRGLKPRGIRYYLNNLERLQKSVPDLSIVLINDFLIREIENGKAPSYLNDYIASLRAYGKFANIDFTELKFFKERSKPKATMSLDEIKAFLTLPPPTVTKIMRNGLPHSYIFKKDSYDKWTLFFKIMAFSGMRSTEVANLRVNQIDFGRQIFILGENDTKTGFARNVPINPAIVSDIQNYLKTLKGDMLFQDKFGKPLCDVEWGRRFHQRIKRLGIKRDNLTPYSLRHSFITRLLEEDINIFKVKKIVGHRRTQTTENYTHLTTKDTIETIKKDPLGRQNIDPREIINTIEDTLSKFQLELDNRFDYNKVKEAISQFTQDLYLSISHQM